MIPPAADEFKAKTKFFAAVMKWARGEWRAAHRLAAVKCSWCGVLFRRYRKDHRFCSKRCRQLDLRQRARDLNRRGNASEGDGE